jgi:NAD(P)H-dependent flavin oxidoreductase YrpB (nitropropane dioxygenase family)
VVNFRSRLIASLIEQGWRVVVLSPTDRHVSRLIACGAEHVPLELDNAGTNPLRELRTLWSIRRALKQIAPSVVLTFTPKVNIYLSMAARSLRVPVIASGGIADGRGMAAALALGAEGVNMGTRFMVTQEAPVHHNIKQALVGATERDTKLMFRTLRNTTRAWSNAVSQEVVATENREGGCNFEDIRHLVSGQRGNQALQSGDVNGGVVAAGQVIGLIDDVPTCADLIERMVADCRAALARAQAWSHPP